MINKCEGSEKSRREAVIKAALFLAFLAAALYIIRFTPAKEFFSPQELNRFLEETGVWGPLAYILWAGGEWGRLFSPKVFFSAALFVFSFFLPKILRKIRKGKEFWDMDILE